MKEDNSTCTYLIAKILFSLPNQVIANFYTPHHSPSPDGQTDVTCYSLNVKVNSFSTSLCLFLTLMTIKHTYVCNFILSQ